MVEYLLGDEGTPVSAEELLEGVRDEAVDPFTIAVKTAVRRLRAKLSEPRDKSLAVRRSQLLNRARREHSPRTVVAQFGSGVRRPGFSWLSESRQA